MMDKYSHSEACPSTLRHFENAGLLATSWGCYLRAVGTEAFMESVPLTFPEGYSITTLYCTCPGPLLFCQTQGQGYDHIDSVIMP
jgi:hypothetical protein